MHNTIPNPANDYKADKEQQDGRRLQYVEALAEELKHILEKESSACCGDEDINYEMEIIERWIECYGSGFVSADKFHSVTNSLLTDLRDRLKLAAEELQRIEGEGGAPSTREQGSKQDELINAIRRSEKLLENIEQLTLQKK